MLWEDVRAAAERGDWHGIWDQLVTLNPDHREALFSLALQQRKWTYLLVLFRQGFGTRRLEEMVDVALTGGSWTFLMEVVDLRPSLFSAPLLTAILSAALDRRLWTVLSRIGPGVSSDIDAMLFDRAVAMVLSESPNPGLHLSFPIRLTNVSNSTERWAFVFGEYFGDLKRGLVTPPTPPTAPDQKYRSERRLDPARRRQAFDELLNEYILSDDENLQLLLLEYLHACPADLRDKFLTYVIAQQNVDCAFDIIAKRMNRTL